MWINCEQKLGPQKEDRCCTMPLQKTEYQAWLCVRSPIWAKKNWLGCSGTIRTVGPCTVFCHCALVCQWLPQITWIAAVEFYGGVLGRLLAGFGRPMLSERRVKKWRRFGVAGVHLGPVQDQDHLACRGDWRRQCVSRRAAKETVVFGQGAKAASSPCDAESVSIGSRVCNHRSRSPRANLQRRRCHGHAHWGSRRPIDSLHCVNAGPRQAWFVCVQTVPCSTVSKRRKSRAGIAVAVLGWWKNGLERAASEIPRRKRMQRM